MIAALNSRTSQAGSATPTPHSYTPPGQGQLFSLRQAASFLGIDRQACRRLANQGVLRVVVLPSGHRRWSRWSLEEFLRCNKPASYSDETTDANGTTDTTRVPVLLVARVSSTGQARARGTSEESDLERQVTRLREYCNTRWPNADITENVRVASGCNFQSAKLAELLKLIWSGKFRGGYLVATYFDRVLRIGFELVELAAREFGVEVVYIADKSDDTDPQKEMIDELLSIMTLYTARASANKSVYTTKFQMTPAIEKYVWTMACQGVSAVRIAKILKREGLVDQHGRNFTRHSIANMLRRERQKLTLLYGTTFVSSFGEFFKARVRAAKGSSINRREILAGYKAYCAENKVDPISDFKVGIEIRQLVKDGKLTTNVKGEWYSQMTFTDVRLV